MSHNSRTSFAFWLLIAGANAGLAFGSFTSGDYWQMMIGVFGAVPSLLFAVEALR